MVFLPLGSSLSYGSLSLSLTTACVHEWGFVFNLTPCAFIHSYSWDVCVTCVPHLHTHEFISMPKFIFFSSRTPCGDTCRLFFFKLSHQKCNMIIRIAKFFFCFYICSFSEWWRVANLGSLYFHCLWYLRVALFIHKDERLTTNFMLMIQCYTLWHWWFKETV